MPENNTPNDHTTQADIATHIENALSNDKMIVRSFYMIILTTAVFGAIGGIIGWLLAIVAPAYFREVYEAMDSEIWQIGVGMGVSRGLFCGLLAGCSVLVATAWYRSRMAKVLTDAFRNSIDDTT